MLHHKMQLLCAQVFYTLRCYSTAINILNHLKAESTKLQGVDFLRAKITMKQGSASEAREIVKEELRYHKTMEATLLLDELGPMDPRLCELESRESVETELFRELLPFTMLSLDRLHALLHGARLICEKNLIGNFVECGVSAGGSSALLAWAIKKYSKTPRFVYCFDTFEGMPPPGPEDQHAGTPAQKTIWGQGTCAAPLESLLTIARRLEVADIIKPVRGLFQETLPVTKGEIGSVALIHLDGDWYSSTIAILENLYTSIADGAYMQVDDYGHWDGCRKAINDFQKQAGVDFHMHTIDGTGVWFIKPAT